MTNSLLIIEDESLLRSELSHRYQQFGWDIFVAEDLSNARELLLNEGLEPLVVLSDMYLPDGNALDLFEEIKQKQLVSEWLFMTAYGSIPDSVRALRLGAYDFLEKPCDLERLDLVINGAARSARAQRRVHEHVTAQTRKYSPESFVGHSVTARSTRNMLTKLGEVPFSALIITGETGTGKGLTARILHHSGVRAEGPMVEINCAALPRELLESELFGHEAGAFTGAKGRRRGLLEQAHGGTLFLDEIGELDLALQAKLLKAIEDRSVRRLGGDREIKLDVQIIAATNRELEEQVSHGTFRSDLYHRLSAFRLHLPTLRERKEDLEELVPQFIAEFNRLAGKNIREIPAPVWNRLYSHHWPGNVRELRNVIERCVLLSDGDVFPVQWLQLTAVPTSNSEDAMAVTDDNRLYIPLDGSMALEEIDRYIIKTVLEKHHGNVMATARALGTTRETLRYRIQKYGLKTDS